MGYTPGNPQSKLSFPRHRCGEMGRSTSLFGTGARKVAAFRSRTYGNQVFLVTLTLWEIGMAEQGDANYGGPDVYDDEQLHNNENDELIGAVGGGDVVDYGRRGGLTDEERRILTQTQILLSRFIVDSAERDRMPHAQYRILCGVLEQENRSCHREPGLDEDILSKAVLALGDDLYNSFTRNREIDKWIDNLSSECVEKSFSKVCTQMFADKQMNWGRVVVLFYLAYRLIAKTLATKDWGSWIKSIFKIALDFFCKYYIHWVVMEGGWKTILQYVQISTKMAAFLLAVSIGTFAYYFYSD